MKRYRIKLGPRSVNILEHPSGGWYSCEDVDAEIERLTQIYEMRISVLQEARHSKFKPREIPECNCAWSALRSRETWVCPVHGYKRL